MLATVPQRVLDFDCARLLHRRFAESGSVVVLERLPRAAGATRWFYCTTEAELEAVIDRVEPGSLASFFFDGRLGPFLPDDDLRSRLNAIIDRKGGFDVCCGFLAHVDPEIAMDLLCHDELDAFFMQLGSGSQVFAGEFPALDDDGESAVTANVPEPDGTVRHHPH
jgi:hypothetical protein